MLRAVCSFTYEVAPVFVLVEAEVLRGLRRLVGWTEGDGIFCPGGSTSNMYAMNLARYRLFPEVKSQGLRELPRLTVFTSSEVTVNIFAKYCTSEGYMHCDKFIFNRDLLCCCCCFPIPSQSHYSVKKGASFMGIGTDNVIIVKADDG